MLYEFTSAAANNGSGFEGLGDNTPFWNIATGLVMLLSRYIPIIAPLALAASLAAKPAAPETAGSLRADSATFGFTLWARDRHSRAADVHAGGRARADRGAPGAAQGVRCMVRKSDSRRPLHGRHDGAARRRLPRRALGHWADAFPAQAEGSLIRRSRWLDRRLAADRPEVHEAPSTSSRGRRAWTTTPRPPAGPTTGRRTPIT